MELRKRISVLLTVCMLISSINFASFADVNAEMTRKEVITAATESEAEEAAEESVKTLEIGNAEETGEAEEAEELPEETATPSEVKAPKLTRASLTGQGTVCTIDGQAYDSVEAALKHGGEDPAIPEAGESADHPTVLVLVNNVPENITISNTRYITLDLNGHVLKSNSGDLSVITNNGKLTITDSAPQAEHYFTFHEDAAWEYIPEPDEDQKTKAAAIEGITSETEVVKVSGGCITGGSGAGLSGGGISLASNASLTMTGGTICGNNASSGGGIYVADSAENCVLQGVKIIGNEAEYGGGVLIGSQGCFAAGTLITMADGTSRKIEDISAGDVVKSFDHETGKVSSAKVYLAFSGDARIVPFTLTFDNGEKLSIAGCHDLLEKEELKYVTLSESNAEEYVGRYFYGEDGAWHRLVSINREKTNCAYYSLYTAKHQNCFANGFLSVPDDADYLLNIYELDENLKADAAQLETDIAEYGLSSFEHINELCVMSREWYEDSNVRYLAIAVGKGLTDLEKIKADYKSLDDVPAREANPTGEEKKDPSILTSALSFIRDLFVITAYAEETLSLTAGNTEAAKFIIGEGTMIAYCYASEGGALNINGQSFTMESGAAVKNCTADSDGGAVYAVGGTFIMNGGTISACSAAKGGAVSCEGGCFHMHGGEITGNSAGSLGGGVYNKEKYEEYADFIKACSFDGKCIVKENYSYHGGERKEENKVKDNVYTSELLFLGDTASKTYKPLSQGSEIGVTYYSSFFAETGRTTGTIGYFTGNGSDTDTQYFRSDVDAYYVVQMDNRLRLCSRITEQPSFQNQYQVKINTEGLDAAPKYQWMKSELTDLKDSSPAIVIGTYTAGNNHIEAVEYQSKYKVLLNTDADAVLFKSSDFSVCSLSWYQEIILHRLTKEGGTYCYAADKANLGLSYWMPFWLESSDPFTVSDVQFICKTDDSFDCTEDKLTGAESGKAYYCTVTYKDGSTDNSDPAVVTIHDAHQWVYALSNQDRTVTAECRAGGMCTYTGKDTALTIHAPTDLTADGTEKKADFGTATGFLGGTLPEIRYEYKSTADGTYAAAIDLKNAGCYKASFTIGEVMACVEYTVKEKEPDDPQKPEPETPAVQEEQEETVLKLKTTGTGTGTPEAPATGTWVTNADGSRSFGNDGIQQFTKTWAYIADSSQTGADWYYFGEDGKAKTGFQTIDGKTYYFREAKDSRECAMETGWQTIDGRLYHFNDSNGANAGAMNTGWLLDNGKSWYYLEKDKTREKNPGAMKTGWMTDPYDGFTYYLDPETGKMVTGKAVIDGKEHYFNETVSGASGWYRSMSDDWEYINMGIAPYGAEIR